MVSWLWLEGLLGLESWLALVGLLGLEGWLSLWLWLLVGWLRLLPHNVDGDKGLSGRWDGVRCVAMRCVVLFNHDGNDALSGLLLLTVLLLLLLLRLIRLLPLDMNWDGLSWTLNMYRDRAGWLLYWLGLLHSGRLLVLLGRRNGPLPLNSRSLVHFWLGNDRGLSKRLGGG